MGKLPSMSCWLVHKLQVELAGAITQGHGSSPPKGMLGGFVSITHCTTSAPVTFSRVGGTI